MPVKLLYPLLLLPVLASAGVEELPPFSEYCKAGSALCLPSIPTNHKLTYAELQSVNEAVNSEVYFETDRDEVYRRPENGYGDCEDYAIEKAERLIALGWTSNSLRLAGVDKNHIVLLATLDDETYVLDSQFQYASNIKQDYRYYDMLQIRGSKYWEIKEY